MKDPKGEHRHKNYHILHTGGFMRCATDEGRSYWCCQNELQHLSADWKLHFSVSLDQLDLAWDEVVSIFLRMECPIGMKVSYMKPEEWSPSQRGRELTVYIYSHDPRYTSKMFAFLPSHPLGPHLEWPAEKWLTFIAEAEQALESAGVRSRGIADGDFPLGKYASIRNEAFVPDGKKDMVYPPNEAGWNGAGHMCPLPLSATRRITLELKRRFSSLSSSFSSFPSSRRTLLFASAIAVIVVAYVLVRVQENISSHN